MASATENRFVNLFINGKQAGATLQSLSAENRRLTSEMRRGKLNADQMSAAIKKFRENNKILQEHRDKLRGINTAWGKMQVSLSRIGPMLGVVSGFALLGSAIRSAAQTVINYQKANSNLQAVLGLTSKETEELRLQQIALGGATQFTASNAADAQTELAKLGFTVKDIISLTPGVLDLAAASGTDLANAASIAGATVRGFGLEASDTQRVVDVMAKSFSSSALDIEKFQFAMRVVAPVAKNANLSLEQTVAMLGVLVDRGVRAESAGTGLRMVLARLAQSGQSWADAMRQINESTNANRTAIELFGIEASTMALILAQNGEALDTLEEKLNNAGGAAKRMAEEQLDNLAGDVVKLTSTWEKFILEIENGEGAIGRSARSVTQWATSVVDGLSKINSTAEKAEKSWFQLIKVTGSSDAIFQPQKIIDNPLLLLGIESITWDNELLKLEKSVRVWAESAQQAFAKGKISDGNDDLEFIRKMKDEYEGNAGALTLINKELTRLEKTRRDAVGEALGWLSADAAAVDDANTNAENYKKTLSELNGELSALKESLEGVSDQAGYKEIEIQIKSKESEIQSITGDQGSGKESKTESEKALEAEQNKYEALLELIRKEEQKLMLARLDGREKEAAEIDIHYDELMSKAGMHADEMLRIEELRQQAKIDLERKYQLEREEAEGVIGEFLAGQGADVQDPEIAALEAKFAEMIDLAKQYGVDTVELEEARTAAIIAVKERLAQRDLEIEHQKWQQQMSFYLVAGDDILNGLRALNQGAADENKRFTEFIQQVGLVQMGVAAGVAIANAIKSASYLVWPANLPAIASAVSATLAFMGQARQVFGKDATIPEYAQGTLNTSGDFIAGDQGREIVSGAQVIPADITQQILAANSFSRSIPQPNFSAINDGLTYTQGRQAQQSSVGGAGSGMEMGVLVSKMDEMIATMRKAQDKRVYLVDKDYDEFLDRKNRNGARVGIRK